MSSCRATNAKGPAVAITDAGNVVRRCGVNRLIEAHNLFLVLCDAASDGSPQAAIEADQVAQALCSSRDDAQVIDLARQGLERTRLVEVELVVGEEPATTVALCGSPRCWRCEFGKEPEGAR